MYYHDSRGRINWKKEVMPKIKERLELFRQQEIVPTLRTMFYSLVSLQVIPNTQNQYQYLNKVTAKARMNGELPIDCFSDQSKSIIQDFNDQFVDAQDYINRILVYLEDTPITYKSRIPKWHNQSNYVEVWIEKETLIGTFQSILKGKDVRIVPNKGINNFSFIYENIKRLKSKAQKGKKIHVRYFGDLDPFGEYIEKAINDKLNLRRIGIDFKRIAVTEDQMRKFRLPENPNPETIRKLNRDPRKEIFIRKHGRLFQIELDALQAYAPDEFKKMIQSSIDNLFDQNIYDNISRKYSYNDLITILKEQITELMNRLPKT
ncbi:MAG: hypothetical protein ACPKQO_01085 [Nitrososphaeraceae archaeon]